MTIFQLAYQYLKRKKAKTLLLFFVMFFISSMILSTTMILHAIHDSKLSMQEKMNAKVVLEIKSERHKITVDDIHHIQQFDEVISLNRMAHGTTVPMNIKPITNLESNDDKNSKISLLSYDDLKKDSGFFDDVYKLSSGSFIDKDTNHGIVINSLLAQHNHLNLGDEIVFESVDHRSITTTIIGLYSSGSETKQDDGLAAIYRIENQVFIDNRTYNDIFEEEAYDKVSVYSKTPTQLNNLESSLKSIFHDKVEVSTSNTLYQQMEAPLNQLLNISNVMLGLTLLSGITIISLLLCMWMRTRKKEIAIFISIGKSKYSILLQMLLEALLVFISSLVATCIIGNLLAWGISTLLLQFNITEIELQLQMQFQDIQIFVGLGGIIVTLAVLCSTLPLLWTNPKDTLSKMEG